jgi:hypothetical protein
VEELGMAVGCLRERATSLFEVVHVELPFERGETYLVKVLR